MGRKPKKPGEPKARHGWEINPATRVVPNKKREPVVCSNCGGVGVGEHMDEDCETCGGTGYVD